MSINIARIDNDASSTPIDMTSFAGGKKRGPCLQVTQRKKDSIDFHNVQMTRSDVEDAMVVMKQWLDSVS